MGSEQPLGPYVDPIVLGFGGPDRDRTGDLLNAIQARSQLRYRPTLERTSNISPAGRRSSKTRGTPGFDWQHQFRPLIVSPD